MLPPASRVAPLKRSGRGLPAVLFLAVGAGLCMHHYSARMNCLSPVYLKGDLQDPPILLCCSAPAAVLHRLTL